MQKIRIINNEVKLIKQVPSHLRDRLVRKTRDVYDNTETVDYNPPPGDDKLLSDAETVQYNIKNGTEMV